MRSRGRIGFVVAFVGMLGAAFGCQLIVSSDVPEFACEEGAVGACPAGLSCVSGKCVSAQATADRVDPPPPDADIPDVVVRPDAKTDASDGGGPLPHGAACRLDKECATGVCGTEGLLGLAAQSTGSVCTSLCCTSAQCPNGFVCLSPGTGGSYCVAAAVLPERQVPVTGGATPGTLCATNADCRSGLCGDSNDGGTKRCVDNCCKAADCAGGFCSVSTISGKYTGFVCTEPKGTFNPNTACTSDTACKSNLCYPNDVPRACRQRCCSNTQCGAGSACIWDNPGAAGVLNFCTPIGTRKAAGETCVDYADCASTQCEPEANGQPDGSAAKKVCRDLCCVDTDCPSTHRCVAAPDQPRVLRCVPK